jgi:putative restriction endonuclease
VVGDEPSRHTFHVAPVESSAIAADPVLRQAPIIRFERRYELALVRRRLHQDRFRAAVMEAYRSRCAICRLRREPLLDAAHIIPDREKLGEAMVPNGLALCKLHHAAFDGNLLGVSPDLKVQVSEELRTEKDGPMLAHGLVAFDGSPIGVPEAPNDQPNRDLLAERFERFLRAE